MVAQGVVSAGKVRLSLQLVPLTIQEKINLQLKGGGGATASGGPLRGGFGASGCGGGGGDPSAPLDGGNGGEGVGEVYSGQRHVERQRKEQLEEQRKCVA